MKPGIAALFLLVGTASLASAAPPEAAASNPASEYMDVHLIG